MSDIESPQVSNGTNDRREAQSAKRPYEPPRILPLGSIELVQYGNGNNIDGTGGWYFPDH